MTRIARTLRRLTLLFAVLVASTAAAGGLDKLPADYTFKPSDGSPGKVTFSHGSHVDPKKPGCTTCHPKFWKTLSPGATADGKPIRHDVMEKGGQCGTCHGKAAFGFDSCDLCHR
ncbi:MAG: c(7)-type cytochrome triheme domain-containing protein [Deltaproteobacteria bacterium]